MALNPEFIKPYVSGTKKRHKAYQQTLTIANDLRIHADGENCGTLISERRPSEPDHIKKYREKIFVAITEPVISKVITSLKKIRRSSDWSVKYNSNIPKSIIEDERPEVYWEENYPTHGSLTVWLFDVFLKSYLVDPNSIVLVTADRVIDNRYKEPKALIFNADKVYDFVEGKYAILESTDKSEYTLEGGEKRKDGLVIYTCDASHIQRWEQKNANGDISLVYQFEHNCKKMPAFKAGGTIKETLDDVIVYKSRISAMVPHLKEAVREYSDLQAEVVQHVHSEKWTYATQKCATCGATGKLKKEDKIVTCTDCKGQGTIPTSPYTAVVLSPPKLGETGIPGGVPFGYVQKQVDIVKVQDERVEKHCYKALSAVNMEFLAETPLSQSGDAKNVDRDELNTFVDSVAEDIVKTMDRVYEAGNSIRYGNLITDKKVLKSLSPKVAVPQNYDLLSASYLLEELNKAKTSKLSPVTIVAMEVEYANKKFNNDPNVRDEVKAVLELDPFPGISDDEKLSRLQNKGISEQDYVISSNIYKFVRRAVEDDKDFLKKNLSEKSEIIKKYADEIIKANSAASAILDPANDPNGGG